MIKIMLLGPSLAAVSGVSTHLNQLFHSPLAKEFNLLHFQVGSEGRQESKVSKIIRFLLSPAQLFVKLIQENPQIVHLNTSLEYRSYWRDVAYLVVARILGKKIVYQVHGGAMPQVFFENNWLLTGILRWVFRSADAVVLLSQEELRAYQDFVPNHHLEVIPNAIEIGIDPEWKKNSTIRDKPLQLVFVGRLAAVKGIFEIIEAIELIRDQGRNIRLIIAGSGPDEDRLMTMVNAKGLNDCVSFVGAVYGQEKDRIWQEADLFVFPTYHREGLPYALLESMAARTPPVISPVGAIPDVMSDGVHGVFVPSRQPEVLAKAIEQLDDDRDSISRMGEAGRERVESYYTVSRLAEDFCNLYHRLMK
ncbi:MAG: glycosyltransferase family 4 protein [Nitrosomonas sp.]|nr:glycosyltransferase family 4 protein [Nitrosomonas sp.]MCG7756788.1 glycosyltransferase family 4 protein [Nitrosomonas sp.]UJP07384.1 MAG: glycosyltransferase family 4 protein [Nitrosomonas sp.]